MKRSISLAAVLCAAILGFAPLPSFAHMPPPFVAGQPVPSLAPIVKRVSPAVVNISTSGHVTVQQSPFFNDPFFQQFFGMPNQPMERNFQALGSGVIVDAAKGYILTNNHVIENADKITVTLYDGRSFKAKVVGRDPDTDIAVLQIDAKDLVQIPLGNSSTLQVGDFVIAIGNPFGLNHTVTAGIVSAMGRTQVQDGKYSDFIQTDAAINPGNSGGALVNLEGQLVGINTMIVTSGGSRGNIGIGFAIPINMAKNVMDQLIKYGKVERGMLGVQVQTLTPELAQALKLAQNQGAVVMQVVPGSQAQKAGIKPNDVIVSVNGNPVSSAQDVSNVIGLLRVGTPVTLGILRNGQQITIQAKIGNTQSEKIASAEHPQLRGISVGNLNESSPAYGQVKGVQVTGVDPNSEAYMAGIRQGDVITAVNREAVGNVAEFRKALNQAGGTVALRIWRNDQVFYVVLGG
ncbi:MAG TPA: DegQ family serine endoprotease [Gammaproteobacteria bacterium]|nr:DegQ family serine endoprotease [Gammaproteobacteria bacterium]